MTTVASNDDSNTEWTTTTLQTGRAGGHIAVAIDDRRALVVGGYDDTFFRFS